MVLLDVTELYHRHADIYTDRQTDVQTNVYSKKQMYTLRDKCERKMYRQTDVLTDICNDRHTNVQTGRSTNR